MSAGYIYIRTNEYWDIYEAVKLGKTLNIIDREQTYITSEIKKGKYVKVIEIDSKQLNNIEKNLQTYFNKLNLHVKLDAGTEYYNKSIINLIIPYFKSINIKYNILSQNDINNLIKTHRIYKNNNENDDNENNDNKTNDKLINIIYNPRDYQENIINKSYEYFKYNNKGLLIIPCGVGKTLISLWITSKLKLNTFIVGVPNILLLKQWEHIISILFHNIPCFIVYSNISIDNIINFLECNKTKCIVITTYSSAHKVYSATEHIMFTFDMKINDEAHHLTTNNMILSKTTKTYIKMLNIKSVKQLSLTATLKQLENTNNNDFVISNDNVKYFGEIIEKKSLLWAINNNIICDYSIQTIITNEEQIDDQLSIFNIINDNDKRLFLSAYSSLESIFKGHSHHLLIYSNNKGNSLKIIQYIKNLLKDNYFDIPDLYYSQYNSDINSNKQKDIINKFKNAKFGIITCVYCLGEGWDFPLLDAVVFAENMSSNIRIVQSALRASRKNKNHPNKITKIILPILNKIDWMDNNDNSDLKKVREIIYQMGLEDETIIQKIKVFRIEIKRQQSKQREKEEIEMVNEFGEYDDVLTQKLRLKTVKRLALDITYEKARKIIIDNNINSKESYYELCDRDNRLTKEPEIIFKGQFTNWIEYLSIKRIYYELETCKTKVIEYLLIYPEIKKNYLDLSVISNDLCKLDPLFPPNGLWVEYYNVKDLRDIITITNKKKYNIIL